LSTPLRQAISAASPMVKTRLGEFAGLEVDHFDHDVALVLGRGRKPRWVDSAQDGVRDRRRRVWGDRQRVAPPPRTHRPAHPVRALSPATGMPSRPSSRTTAHVGR
jgi:hypothetical protein